MDEQVVIVDTDVFSTVVVAGSTTPRAAEWRQLLLGATLVISAQTQGEVLYGAKVARWGPSRLAGLHGHLAAVATAPVTEAVIAAYATLRSQCRDIGHPLHEKIHMGDAWVAATAIGHALPLLSGDAVYEGCPSLSLWTGG